MALRANLTTQVCLPAELEHVPHEYGWNTCGHSLSVATSPESFTLDKLQLLYNPDGVTLLRKHRRQERVTVGFSQVSGHLAVGRW